MAVTPTPRPPRLSWGGKLIFAIAAILTKNYVLRPIMTVFSAIGISWFNTKLRQYPREADNMLRRIAGIYYKASDAWILFATSYMEKLTGHPISAQARDNLLGGGVGVTARTIADEIGKEFLTPMLGMIMPGTIAWDKIREDYGLQKTLEYPAVDILNPADGLLGAERFLGVNLQFQLQAWMLHLIGDTVSMGQMKALKDLPNAISWSYGVGWLSWLVMGTPFQTTIADPLRKLLGMLYRPTTLTVAQAIDAWNSGYIDFTRMHKIMAEAGYQDDLIPVLVNQGTTRIPIGTLKDAYLAGRMTWNIVTGELQRAGYNSHSIMYLIGGELQKDDTLLEGDRSGTERSAGIWELERHDDLIKKWATECISSYESGFITLTEFYEALKAAGWEDVEQTSPITPAIQAMFDKYGITDMKRVGPIALQTLISLQKREKQSQFTKAEIRDMWAQGVIADDVADTYLQRIGMTPTNIAILKDLWGGGLIERDVMNLYLKLKIGPTKAKDYLRRLGISAADADTLMTLWDAKLAQMGAPRPRYPSKYDLRVLLAAKKISSGEVVTGLMNLGYDEKRSRDLLAIWRGVTQTEIDKLQDKIDALEAPAPPTLTRTEVKQLFDKGLMGLQAVYQYLKDKGYADEDALLLTQLYTGASVLQIQGVVPYTPTAVVPRDLTITEIKQLYEAGAPGFDTLGTLARMKGIGYSATDAANLVSLWVPWSPPEAGA